MHIRFGGVFEAEGPSRRLDRQFESATHAAMLVQPDDRRVVIDGPDFDQFLRSEYPHITLSPKTQTAHVFVAGGDAVISSLTLQDEGGRSRGADRRYRRLMHQLLGGGKDRAFYSKLQAYYQARKQAGAGADGQPIQRLDD